MHFWGLYQSHYIDSGQMTSDNVTMNKCEIPSNAVPLMAVGYRYFNLSFLERYLFLYDHMLTVVCI